jgi:hypothetical protein
MSTAAMKSDLPFWVSPQGNLSRSFLYQIYTGFNNIDHWVDQKQNNSLIDHPWPNRLQIGYPSHHDSFAEVGLNHAESSPSHNAAASSRSGRCS